MSWPRHCTPRHCTPLSRAGSPAERCPTGEPSR
jgi:hypothetical protein